ncbi:hypothetical protein LCGC14_2723050, partial [marine sediment metagenome]
LVTLMKKTVVKKKRKRRPQAFDVLARPRRKKGRKRPKLIKINKVPLSKVDAKNLRNFITDRSLARTSRIKLRGRGRPQKPRLPVPPGFAKRTRKKFRSFRIVKGKKIPLRKGKVIEKSRFLLDTKSEKRSITLSRKVAELNRKARSKLRPIKRSQPRRKVSQKTLDALARGRKIRLQNLKKKR